MKQPALLLVLAAACSAGRQRIARTGGSAAGAASKQLPNPADEPFSVPKVEGNLQKLMDHPPEDLDGVGDLYSPAVAELDISPASSAPEKRDCRCPTEDAPAGPGTGLVQVAELSPPLATPSMALVATSSHLVTASKLRGVQPLVSVEKSACACEPDPPAGPDTDIDGEVIWLSECTLTQKDLEFWKLVRTEYRSGGIILPATTGYGASCDDCKSHNLQCSAKDVKLERGYCLCMWRVDGVDPTLKLVPCGRCVQECVGKFLNFDLGTYLEPVQQHGLCIRKKSYFVLD